MLLVTCADDLLDLHTRDVDLFGEFSYGLVRVLVGEGVNVDFGSRSDYRGFSSGNRPMNFLHSVCDKIALCGEDSMRL